MIGAQLFQTLSQIYYTFDLTRLIFNSMSAVNPLILNVMLQFIFMISILKSRLRTTMNQKQPFWLTVLLGIFFLLIFTSDTSFSSIVTQVYQQKDLKSLGPTALATSAATFTIFGLVAPGITINNKAQMVLASFLFSMQFVAGLLLQFVPNNLAYIVVISAAVINGIGTAILWTAFGGYMNCMFVKHDIVADQGHYFSLWSAIYSIQSITGSVITTFALGFFNTEIYFTVISFLGLFSSFFCFFFIKNVQSAQEFQKKQKFNALKSAKEVFKFYPKMLHVLGFVFINGIVIAYTYTSLIRFVAKQQSQQQQNLKSGIAFIFCGFGAILGGYASGNIYDKFSFKVSASSNIVLMLITLASTFAASYITNLYYTYFIFFLWGVIQYYFDVWLMVTCTRFYDGKLQAFAVNKQLSNISFISFQIFTIVTKNQYNMDAIVIGMLIVSMPMIIGLIFLIKTKRDQRFYVKSENRNQLALQVVQEGTTEKAHKQKST